VQRLCSFLFNYDKEAEMVLKSLILGVLCSVGVFAVKSGVGLSYCFAGAGRMRAKVGSAALFSLMYLLVFAGVGLMLQRVDLVNHLDALQRWLQSGMLVHLVIASLMIGWGVMLLKNSKDRSGTSRGWLLLAMPCPVCFAVILFSAAILFSYSPEHVLRTGLLFYLVFMAISLLTPVVVHLLGRRTSGSPDGFLGGAMLLIAFYFLLSATIMPQFSELDQVYRMASYHGETQTVDVRSAVKVALLVVAVFLAGCGYSIKKIRSCR
jgi:predicted transporter